MEELFYSNHPLSCSGGDSLPPLATGIPKLKNDIFKIWCS